MTNPLETAGTSCGEYLSATGSLLLFLKPLTFALSAGPEEGSFADLAAPSRCWPTEGTVVALQHLITIFQYFCHGLLAYSEDGYQRVANRSSNA